MQNGVRRRAGVHVAGRAPARAVLTLMAGAVFAQSAPAPVDPASVDSMPSVSPPPVDLVPVSLERLEGGADSPPPTPVRVAIVVRNASGVDMTAAQGAAGWTVQVQGYSANPLVVRHPLRAGEEHRFAVTVIVPCGKVTPLEVRVNMNRSVTEANLDNNRARFPVAGNACPISVRTGSLRPVPRLRSLARPA